MGTADQVIAIHRKAMENQKKALIDKAVKWITNNWREYVYQDGDGIVHFGHWENDFRKAMEE
jgi:hypothetical protein